MPKATSVPSVLDPRCPSRLVLDRIADKWTALVIQILAAGTMRYAALQRDPALGTRFAMVHNLFWIGGDDAVSAQSHLP